MISKDFFSRKNSAEFSFPPIFSDTIWNIYNVKFFIIINIRAELWIILPTSTLIRLIITNAYTDLISDYIRRIERIVKINNSNTIDDKAAIFWSNKKFLGILCDVLDPVIMQIACYAHNFSTSPAAFNLCIKYLITTLKKYG